jgi:hypothetical protein
MPVVSRYEAAPIADVSGVHPDDLAAWGELIMGHPLGNDDAPLPTTRQNMRDAMSGENGARALDPVKNNRVNWI